MLDPVNVLGRGVKLPAVVIIGILSRKIQSNPRFFPGINARKPRSPLRPRPLRGCHANEKAYIKAGRLRKRRRPPKDQGTAEQHPDVISSHVVPFFFGAGGIVRLSAKCVIPPVRIDVGRDWGKVGDFKAARFLVPPQPETVFFPRNGSRVESNRPS